MKHKLASTATHIEADSDGTGKFAFNAVSPGSYTINAEAPGLIANRTIEVTANSASEISLEMKVQAVSNRLRARLVQIRLAPKSLLEPARSAHQRSGTRQIWMNASKAADPGKQQSARVQYGITDRRSGDLRGLESVLQVMVPTRRGVYAQAVILHFPIQSIGCYITTSTTTGDPDA